MGKKIELVKPALCIFFQDLGTLHDLALSSWLCWMYLFSGVCVAYMVPVVLNV